MPAAIPIAIAASSAISAYGAHKAANASKQAAATQAAGADKALNFNQQLFGQQQQNFAPYQAAGQGAVGNLGQLLSGARPPSMPASVQRVVGAPQPMAQGPQPLQGPSQAVGKLVTLRSPDGEVGQVPEAQLQHWLSKGAQVVQ